MFMNIFFCYLGTDFSSNQQDNTVYIEDFICRIISSSPTEITCKIGLNSGLLANRPYSIELSVNGLGFALQNDFYQINFVPAILSVTPTQGNFVIFFSKINTRIFVLKI